MELLDGGGVLTIIVDEDYQDEIYCVLSKEDAENKVIGRSQVRGLTHALYPFRKTIGPVNLYKDKHDEFQETIIVFLGKISVAVEKLIITDLHSKYPGVQFKVEK